MHAGGGVEGRAWTYAPVRYSGTHFRYARVDFTRVERTLFTDAWILRAWNARFLRTRGLYARGTHAFYGRVDCTLRFSHGTLRSPTLTVMPTLSLLQELLRNTHHAGARPLCSDLNATNSESKGHDSEDCYVRSICVYFGLARL